jgi:hypothetical protein
LYLIHLFLTERLRIFNPSLRVARERYMQKAHLKPKDTKSTILMNKSKFGLTYFEMTFNLLLVILFTIVYYTDTNNGINNYAKELLTLMYLSFALPMNFAPYLTIYSRKIGNFIIQGIILYLMYINKEKFMVTNISIYIPIVCFTYFNLMRFIGQLYIGKDPIWIGGKSIGMYSDSKQRKNTKADANWAVIYFIVAFVLCFIYANKRLIF